MMGAIFESTGQALHVSFLVMAHEARQGTPLRRALLRIMEAIEHPTKAQQLWMDQLRGTEDGARTVDFSGLSPDEVRGQCAMVTQTVRDHLPEAEMHCVCARYIPTETEEIGRDGDKKPIYRFYFSQQRVDSIQWLSRWLRGYFPDLSLFQLDHLVAKHFAERKEVRKSFRDLAQELGGNHMVYARLYPKLKAHLDQLENVAVARLTPLFRVRVEGCDSMLVGYGREEIEQYQ
jgi:hypothetical protein